MKKTNKKSKNTTLPFHNEMKKAIVEGRKKKTTRYDVYWVDHDMFYYEDDKNNTWEVHFKVSDINQCRLAEAVDLFWEQEGFNSKEEMIELWKKLHPRRGYRALDTVYVHDIIILQRDIIKGPNKQVYHTDTEKILEMVSGASVMKVEDRWDDEERIYILTNDMGIISRSKLEMCKQGQDIDHI